MKKLLCIILVMCMVTSLFVCNITALAEGEQDAINVRINGVSQSYDVMPIIKDGRTLVPMRGIFEAIGAEINWDDATKTVIGTKGDTKVTLQIGNTKANVGDKEVTLDVPAEIIDGRTMVPVRFISESSGCNVDWAANSKTVLIDCYNDLKQAGMDNLINTYHRPVPTEFEKSNDLNDIYHYPRLTNEENEKRYNEAKTKGKVVATNEEFLSTLSLKGGEHGTLDIVDVEGQSFDKAARVKCEIVPESSAAYILRTGVTPELEDGGGIEKRETIMIRFYVRTLSGGDENGNGKIQFQVEKPVTFGKDVFDFVTVPKEWTPVYFIYRAAENATSIGVRCGFYTQEIEIGGFEIVNFGKDYDTEELPATAPDMPDLEKDAQWRKDANANIEKIRKGDFKVVVKDKNGNPVEGANVNFDMFEHEFKFGTCLSTTMINKNQSIYAPMVSRDFNAMVSEGTHKWKYYELESYSDEKGKWADQLLQACLDYGIKYYRGHILMMNAKTIIPDDVLELVEKGDKEASDKRVKDHIYHMINKYKDIFDVWEVANENSTTGDTYWRKQWGDQVMKDWYDWAGEVKYDGLQIMLNDWVADDRYIKLLDYFKETGINYDSIGMQSHVDSTGEVTTRQPSDWKAFYDRLDRDYGKNLTVTEYSCGLADHRHQSNYTRDFMINAFATESMNAFYVWSFWDGSTKYPESLMYNRDRSPKLTAFTFEDLVYNKWWTRDAKATTGADGSATIRGYYGDYDVKVTHNGVEKNIMCAFHKGFDNVLEVTIDETADNSTTLLVNYVPKTRKVNTEYTDYGFTPPKKEEKPATPTEVVADASLPEGGEVIVSSDEFLKGTLTGSVISDKGMLTVDVDTLGKNDAIAMLTVKKPLKDLIKPGDVCMLTFKARLVSGTGYVKAQVQATKASSYKKALFDKTSYGSEWVTCYMPFTGIDDMSNVAIRFGGDIHKTELKDIQLINYKDKVTIDKLPSTIVK